MFLRRYGRCMQAASRSSNMTARSFAATLFVGISILAACSDEVVQQAAAPSPPACDSAKCAAGNTCLPLDGETKCRKTCESNADPATSCPFGYTCVDQLTGDPAFCVQDTAVNAAGDPLVRKESGQWGAACQPNLGIENPGCDGEQGFRCYGTSPTDGDSYCTRYDCETDSDCGAGFWCGKTNMTPNVKTAKRGTVGQVQNICLRRTYCATCQVDLDCPPVAGKAQHCVADANGAGFCTPECGTTQNCPTEARCRDVGIGAKVCYPRSRLCVGDGSLCSPCRVDTDCGEDGVCVKGQYTTEKTCAKKSATSCGTKAKPTQGSCPTTVPDGSKANVRCLGSNFEQVPPDYCHGIYLIGKEGGGDIGCWTPAR